MLVDIDTDDIFQAISAEDVLDFFSIHELLLAYNKSKRMYEYAPSQGQLMAESMQFCTNKDSLLSDFAFCIDQETALKLAQHLKHYKKIDN